jgi:hypothetical protein
VNAQDFIKWARNQFSGPFCTLAANDRLAYVTGDPLALLAMAAGVTNRVRLMTSIGVDEVIMEPTHPALAQLDRAAAAVF